MYTLQESPLYQEVCTMDMNQFFVSMKAYGQAIDSILTQIKEVMPNRTNCFSRCCVRNLGLVCKV